EELLASLCRHQPYLRTDYIDAPEHPAERLSLSATLLAEMLNRLRADGRYDLIIVDPDTGAGDWHYRLLMERDQIIWLATDGVQSLHKASKLFRYWQEHREEAKDPFAGKVYFTVNRAQGRSLHNRWTLPGGTPSISLPYVPQWKNIDQPSRWLGAPAFC